MKIDTKLCDNTNKHPITKSGEHWQLDHKVEQIELFFDCLEQVQPQVSCLCPRKTRSSAGRSTTSSSSPLLDFSGAKTHFSLIFYPWMTKIKILPIFDGYMWRWQKLTSQEWWLCPLHWRSDGWVRNTWLGRWPTNSRNSWWDPVLMLKY